MIQREFADKAKTILEPDDNVIGLAVADSWLTNEIDEFSEESQFHIAVRNVQNGSVVTIRFDDKQGNTRGYSRLCVEGEDPIDHIRSLVALAKLEV